MQKICIDTGVLNIFLSKSPTNEIIELFRKIRNLEVEAYIPKEIMIELFKHQCRINGVETSKLRILTFLREYPVVLVDLSVDLIVKAGILKCQIEDLSYNDCILIAYALNRKISIHSTDNGLKNIPQNIVQRLKIVKYQF